MRAGGWVLRALLGSVPGVRQPMRSAALSWLRQAAWRSRQPMGAAAWMLPL